MPIHISGHDVHKAEDIESQSNLSFQHDEVMQRDELIARLRAEDDRQQAEHMANLNAVALWFHRPLVAVLSLIGYSLLTLLALASRFEAAYTVLIAGAIALAVIDWCNFRTFHGKVKWPVLRLNHPALYWSLIVGMLLFFFIPTIAYLVQCLQSAQQVGDVQHVRLQQNIARLERELLPSPEETASPFPTEQGQDDKPQTALKGN